MPAAAPSARAVAQPRPPHAPQQALAALPRGANCRQPQQRPRSRAPPALAARRGGGPSEDEVWRRLGAFADKYIAGGRPQQERRSGGGGGGGGGGSDGGGLLLGGLPVQGVHVLLAALAAVAALGALGALPPARLALDHDPGRWWAAASDALASPSAALLGRNLFLTYMFGRVVESSWGSAGALALTWLAGAAGGSAAAWALLPRRAPLGGCACSGALFALFAGATVLNPRKHWHWQRVLELAALAPFVCQQLLAGHAGLAQWCVLAGQRLGAWVPLLGGLAGAAAAAAALALAARVAAAAAAQAQQQRGGAGGAAGGQPAPSDDGLALLLTRVAASLLRRVL
ncbi:RBL11 [Scenedesmus sp. PABB004]|nr:RBL11 [Scenedesmus sp. PABB004]